MFVAIATLGVGADLWTKSWVFGRRGMPHTQPTQWIIEDVIGFQTSLNPGALFGIGQGQVVFFAVMSIIAIFAVVGWFVWTAWKSRWLTVSLGMILGGILGNLYDRLGWHGLTWIAEYTPSAELVGKPAFAVRDWILVMIGTYPWPNFNIADSLLVCGVGLLMVYTLVTVPASRAEDKANCKL